MLGFVVWLALLAGAGLCYPRRPRLSGMLFLSLGVWSVLLSQGIAASRAAPGRLSWGSAAVWFLIGAWYLVKFRHPDARARHVEYWTAKS